MPTCKKCQQEKPKGEMAVYAGEVTETCMACRWPNRVVKAPATSGDALPAVVPAPRLAIAPTEIVVEASLGFAAKVDGDNLVISQANHSRENDDDNITLTRSEARKLFDLFGEWIVA